MIGVTAEDDADAARNVRRVPHGVAQQVPEHLAQMLAVKLHPAVTRRFEKEALGWHALIGDIFLEKFEQPGIEVHPFGNRTVSSRTSRMLPR